jgi:hypothetical protein
MRCCCIRTSDFWVFAADNERLGPLVVLLWATSRVH